MSKDYYNSLVAQIILGQQDFLKDVMLDQMSEWSGRNITDIDELTIREIKGWLMDCWEEIQQTGLIK
jgi:hypothetical protein